MRNTFFSYKISSINHSLKCLCNWCYWMISVNSVLESFKSMENEMICRAVFRLRHQQFSQREKKQIKTQHFLMFYQWSASNKWIFIPLKFCNSTKVVNLHKNHNKCSGLLRAFCSIMPSCVKNIYFTTNSLYFNYLSKPIVCLNSWIQKFMNNLDYKY